MHATATCWRVLSAFKTALSIGWFRLNASQRLINGALVGKRMTTVLSGLIPVVVECGNGGHLIRKYRYNRTPKG